MTWRMTFVPRREPITSTALNTGRIHDFVHPFTGINPMLAVRLWAAMLQLCD